MPAPRDRLPDELVKALMPAEQYAAWQRQQEASKEFWRTLNGPAQRPLGSNADEWHLFVEENKDSSTYLAVQIAEAIDDAERRGARDALKERAETRAATTTTERARRAIKALREPDASLHGVANTVRQSIADVIEALITPVGEGREICECEKCGRNHWKLGNPPNGE